ncbi:GNAT family N-acetyltransferase [Peribacillus glennii]|uniref:GNAT family N-acetyltransferase n=1 Tax=Peribacillus glennii TaxID=2303991 RepID=A0A372LFG4_9BACI|nr:GNAT family N-acetyltransferase [Peribacillus glennii]RFU65063.1 GNAT family N-acetyltransferase [Peribacillus glennii]
MEIIQADIEALEGIVPLFNAYRVFYGQPNDELGARKFIQERITNKESVIFIAYESDKQPVGFVQVYPVFSSVGMQRAYILNDLFVVPAGRKKGVGRSLVERVYQFCEEMKGRYVTLQTAPDNHTAKALYEGMGMHLDNEYENYIKYF